MPDNSQKLKQRATLISILKKYTNATKIDNIQLKNDIDIISEFNNKAFVFKTLLNEVISYSGVYADICSIIAFETIDDETFEKVSIEFLKNKNIEDEKKIHNCFFNERKRY